MQKYIVITSIALFIGNFYLNEVSLAQQIACVDCEIKPSGECVAKLVGGDGYSACGCANGCVCFSECVSGTEDPVTAELIFNIGDIVELPPSITHNITLSQYGIRNSQSVLSTFNKIKKELLEERILIKNNLYIKCIKS